MSTVLVTYASRTGSTREIAEAVADELRQTDHTVALVECSAAPDIGGFDAAVIGSALHGRRWMPDAVDYLRRQARHLIDRPTFLFQSGPCSDGTTHVPVTRSPKAVRRITRRYGLTDPVTFTGRIDHTHAPGRFTRWSAAPVAPGDYRDWTAIRAWGYAIGFEIHAYLDHRPQRRHDLSHPVTLLPTRQ
ncbi:MAG TPA: flavodoxin domain-containing protein [Microlunatus sp.]|nr:flavodoxin domain-containing protein [Microlunatus sp.]